MIDTYRIVLDSGALGWTSFTNREQAHAHAIEHNRRSSEQKARGDLVSLRRAVGVVKIRWKPKKIEHRRGRKRRVKAALDCPPSQDRSG